MNEELNIITQSKLLEICNGCSSLLIAKLTPEKRHRLTQDQFEQLVRHSILLSIKATMADKETAKDARKLIEQANHLIEQMPMKESLLQKVFNLPIRLIRRIFKS